jgi:hypothetical protein
MSGGGLAAGWACAMDAVSTSGPTHETMNRRMPTNIRLDSRACKSTSAGLAEPRGGDTLAVDFKLRRYRVEHVFGRFWHSCPSKKLSKIRRSPRRDWHAEQVIGIAFTVPSYPAATDKTPLPSGADGCDLAGRQRSCIYFAAPAIDPDQDDAAVTARLAAHAGRNASRVNIGPTPCEARMPHTVFAKTFRTFTLGTLLSVRD